VLVNRCRRLARQAYYRLKGFPLYRILDGLERSQYWSQAQRTALQDEKLRRLVRHAYETVPYYRRRMDEAGVRPDDVRGVADLPRLPLLTRQQVRDAGADLISRAGSVGPPTCYTTGGSTGEPLRTWTDLRGIAWANAAYYRGLRYAGYDLDRDRLAILFGGSLKEGRRLFRRCGLGGLDLHLSAYDLRPETTTAYHEKLQRFRPHFLKGYAGATYLLARSLAAAGLSAPPLRAVFTTCEHLPDYQRRYIEDFFGARVFDYYGCVEIHSLGYECAAHQGFHIPEEHVVVETAGLEGEESDNGRGALVLTDLDNYYMPLLRYRNGDAGTVLREPCSCGRMLRRIAPLHGRISDLLRSTDGNLVGGGVVDYVLGATRHIREFCLIQEDERTCRLQYILDKTDEEIPLVVGQLKQFLGRDMTIITEPVASIPLTAAGKRRFTMSRLNDT
jgi:phenylacetate-CoA ligase